mmetsp:Transcript_14170/g.16233  ORF Transcript_14170/g.16233 Transcript_14170/m.16233 type:complete len:108 (+) Transcript_14170:355-678(+)|eukprot:CAMPEP_0204846890 /NCGR_PEP_ID=MMETSP1347-20130617/2331_1 /ASSEMBLY_ACC=CAM_ASM_000690 /TAXON_ID=215587 /ORGANISM="Aplanochytrium stocchinoi, Strain GSBS06" /LENGTH=107 /DNA_ID=CAMNT_0051987639 /DNA_START=331 /DNA_END=654 /DNA_ORIENTATION=-
MSWQSALAKGLAVTELRFIMCPSGAGSQGLRSFVKEAYSEVKVMNPSLPLLVRESAGAKATILARYPAGKEVSVQVENFDKKNIGTSLGRLLQGYEAIQREGPGWSV